MQFLYIAHSLESVELLKALMINAFVILFSCVINKGSGADKRNLTARDFYCGLSTFLVFFFVFLIFTVFSGRLPLEPNSAGSSFSQTMLSFSNLVFKKDFSLSFHYITK